MQAIIETGGKQYKVGEGDIIYVERLEAEDGAAIVLDKVLAVFDGEKIKLGDPLVGGVTVGATVVKSGKQKKIHIFKYKAKKNVRRRQGHRQPYTKLQIGKISIPAKSEA